MRARHFVLGLALALLAWAAPAGAELPTVTHEGRAYVELRRVAAVLQTRPDTTPSSIRAYLRIPNHVVTLTRNVAQVLVDGAPVVLDAPVRVREGVWLVPESFVSRVLPRLVGAGALAVAGPPAAPETTLEELRYRSYPSFTRLVLETSAPVEHTIEAQGPKELRIRVRRLTGAPRNEEVRDGFVDAVRLERAGADVLLRVTFEGAAGTLRPLTLEDPPRLVFDLVRPTEPAARENSGALVTPLRTIVLDAGHGGHDSGAVGPTGLMEKELVLDVTLRVRKLVEERLNLRVLLSRDTDTFIPLRDRTSFANKGRADLFVSIHANAHRQSATDGVETYFLSSEATDSAARQVAALENGTVQAEQAGGRGNGRVDIVRTILWDLAQSEFQLESSRLAEIVQDAMTESLRIPSRGVKQAGFYVLGGAAMPAILLEIGFVTNPREERRLKTAKYRDEIARAILAGLAEYKRHWDRRLRAAGEPAPVRTR
ncbi:MAG: hypothetical protein A3I17_07490 [Candidatus Rokubacteria bacterium RIFCSPLOWO2_02_FULL_72_37]|nr:MAG: hypothetical protein A3I17_07490 [Candidatus Rokubacteria bacterium RIFCSPLOWO2_02_FULL_72_37]